MPYDIAPSEVFVEELEVLLQATDIDRQIVEGMAIDAPNYGLSSDPEALLGEVVRLKQGYYQSWFNLIADFGRRPGVERLHSLGAQRLACRPACVK